MHYVTKPWPSQFWGPTCVQPASPRLRPPSQRKGLTRRRGGGGWVFERKPQAKIQEHQHSVSSRGLQIGNQLLFLGERISTSSAVAPWLVPVWSTSMTCAFARPVKSIVHWSTECQSLTHPRLECKDGLETVHSNQELSLST